MKYRTTQKYVRESYPTTIGVGYCTLQYLLRYREPEAYTARAEGWGADIYRVFPGVAIVTGYDPFGAIRPDYEVSRRYETKAEAIACNTRIPEERKRREINDLLRLYVNEVTGVERV